MARSVGMKIHNVRNSVSPLSLYVFSLLEGSHKSLISILSLLFIIMDHGVGASSTDLTLRRLIG